MYRIECLAKATNLVIAWDTAKTKAEAEKKAKIYSVGEQKYTYVKVFKVA